MAAIESLISRRGGFDYIILETSGLADPGNLAPLFWVDDGLGSTIYLDGIVTLIDAKNILLSLDERPPAPDTGDQHEGAHMTTAHSQISHADVLVINKSDSVTPEYLAQVEARVRAINGLAKIHVTQYGQIPQLEGFLLDLHAYDGVDGLDAASTNAHSHIDPVRSPHLPSPPTLPHSIHSLTYSLTHSLTSSLTSPLSNLPISARRQYQPSPSPSPLSPPPNSPPSPHGSNPSSGTPPSPSLPPPQQPSPPPSPPLHHHHTSPSTASKAASPPSPARPR